MSVTRDPQDPRDAAADDVTPDAAAPDDASVATDETDDVATAGEPDAPRTTAGEAVDDAPGETGSTDDLEADQEADAADGRAPERDAAPAEPGHTVDPADDELGDDLGDDEPTAAATATSPGEQSREGVAGTAAQEGDEDADAPDHVEGGGTPDADPDPAAPDSDDDAPAGTTGADPSAPAEPPATTGTIGAVGRHGSPTRPEPRGLRGLGRALRPRASRSQIVVGVLCALLGFALVVQVSQTQEDQLSSLRQSDLVRLLDDVTQRSGELEDQVSSLESTRDELQSGSGRERAALELAEQQAETLGILSGRLPAEGPGVEIEVVEGAEPLDAFALFNVLEELRNAGAEAMEVNGVRLVASSYFEDSAEGVVVDGQTISSPYRWNVIGDPSTLETALEIPGGAMASLRADGARTTITQQDRVEVAATVEPGAPQYATPVPADE